MAKLVVGIVVDAADIGLFLAILAGEAVEQILESEWDKFLPAALLKVAEEEHKLEMVEQVVAEVMCA